MKLIGIDHHELGKQMAEEGCADRIERIEKLMIWAQQRALAERNRRELALDRMVQVSEELGLYDIQPEAK